MDLQIDPLRPDTTVPGTVSEVYAVVITAIELLGWRHGRTAGEASQLVWAESVEKNRYEQIIPFWIRKGPLRGEVMVRLVVRGVGPETKLQILHDDAIHVDIARACFKELIRRADELEKGKFEIAKGKFAKRTVSYKELQRLAKWP